MCMGVGGIGTFGEMLHLFEVSASSVFSLVKDIAVSGRRICKTDGGGKLLTHSPNMLIYIYIYIYIYKLLLQKFK